MICPKCLTKTHECECSNETATPPTALTEQVGGSHYKSCAIQPVEFFVANKVPFLEGCVIKRCIRHSKKNGAEDIRKAIHELRLILKLTYNVDE